VQKQIVNKVFALGNKGVWQIIKFKNLSDDNIHYELI
jgi:hypothetical protein